MLFSHIWKIEKIGSLSASLTQNDNSVGGVESAHQSFWASMAPISHKSV